MVLTPWSSVVWIECSAQMYPKGAEFEMVDAASVLGPWALFSLVVGGAVRALEIGARAFFWRCSGLLRVVGG